MASALTNIVSGIGTGVVEKGAIEAESTIQRLMLQYNADIDRANASIVRASGKQKAADVRKAGEEEISIQKAAIGASGLTSDTFDILSMESVSEVEKDVQAIELQSLITTFNLEQSAQLSLAQAEAVRAGKELKVAGVKQGVAASSLKGISDIFSSSYS